MEQRDERPYADIEISRPTGPRLTASEPISLGQLAVSKTSKTAKSVVAATVTFGAAGVAFLTRHKFATGLGVSAISGIAIHAIVAVTMMGIIDNSRVSSGTYTGPGDTQSGWAFFNGVIAFTSANRGSRVANVCDSTGGTDVACSDFNSDSSTGIIETKAVGGITCPGNTNCTVKTLYDQTVGTACGGSPCDFTQATVATRFKLSSSQFSTNPGIVAAGSQHMSTGGFNGGGGVVTPSAAVCVFSTTAVNTTQGIMDNDAGTGTGFFLQVRSTTQFGWVPANQLIFGGTPAINTPYVFIGTAIAGSNNSVSYVNGTSQATGTASPSLSGQATLMGDSPFTQPFTGSIGACGYVQASMNSTAVGNLTTTLRNIFGF